MMGNATVRKGAKGKGTRAYAWVSTPKHGIAPKG
jgi:hypothetical protein